MKKLLLAATVLLFSLINFGAFAQDISAAYRQDVMKMFKANGTSQSYKLVVGQMIDLYKSQLGLSDDLAIQFKKEFTSDATLDELLADMVPIYHKHLTHQEVKDIIAFYETPTGKKLAKETPAITSESMEAGQELGARLGMKLAEKMKKK